MALRRRVHRFDRNTQGFDAAEAAIQLRPGEQVHLEEGTEERGEARLREAVDRGSGETADHDGEHADGVLHAELHQYHVRGLLGNRRLSAQEREEGAFGRLLGGMLAIHLGSEGVCRERLRDASVDDPVEVERGEAGHLLLARLLLCRTKGRTDDKLSDLRPAVVHHQRERLERELKRHRFIARLSLLEGEAIRLRRLRQRGR